MLERRDGSKKYEVGVYNRRVRQAVQMGEKVRGLDDSWADLQWVEVWAKSEAGARTKISQRFPPENGFVITDVVEQDDKKWV